MAHYDRQTLTYPEESICYIMDIRLYEKIQGGIHIKKKMTPRKRGLAPCQAHAIFFPISLTSSPNQPNHGLTSRGMN
jgi:hypothetical protein